MSRESPESDEQLSATNVVRWTSSKSECMSPVVVAALYHFARLDELDELRSSILAEMSARGVRGTMLIANEVRDSALEMADLLESLAQEVGRDRFESLSAAAILSRLPASGYLFTSSTRRFFARPSSTSFDATGDR